MLSSKHCYENVTRAIEHFIRGLLGVRNQHRNRVFRSTSACPRDHEVLLRHERGNQRLLCQTSTPVLGTIPIHTFPPPRSYLGHLGGFVTLSLIAIELIALGFANIILLLTDLLLLGDQENYEIILLHEKITYLL